MCLSCKIQGDQGVLLCVLILLINCAIILILLIPQHKGLIISGLYEVLQVLTKDNFFKMMMTFNSIITEGLQGHKPCMCIANAIRNVNFEYFVQRYNKINQRKT